MKHILYLFLFGLTACGEQTGSNDLSGKQYILAGGLPAFRLNKEKIVFSGTMPRGGDSRKHFRFRIRPPSSPARVRFFFFADRNLSGGLELVLHMEEGNIVVTFSINGYKHTVSIPQWHPEFVDISLDVHNDHEDVHFIAWKGRSTFFPDGEECVFEETCLYNSEAHSFIYGGPWGKDGGQGRASGTFWGYSGDIKLIDTVWPLQENRSNA